MAFFNDVPFGDTFFGKRALVTGHTGFKGGRLSRWLEKLGANGIGLASLSRRARSVCDACGLPYPRAAPECEAQTPDARDRFWCGPLARPARARLSSQVSFKEALSPITA